jgi:type III restriction enzyme
MQLKAYQTAALSALESFLASAREVGAEAAFAAVTGEAALKERLGRYAKPYKEPKGLTGVPHVCIRLPTGGGKTLMAAHAVKTVRDAGLGRDYPLVLWLVTSDVIRVQTADALGDPRHPYRAALDEAFGGRVRVFDIADFAQVRPHDLAQNACIIVGTVQTLRITDTNQRKVYAHHEELEPHFSGLSRAVMEANPDLERTPGGTVKYSFANLLHLHRPAMIVDEAHNVVSSLSDEMRRRINPSCVVEFTATPTGRSNILFNATAAELKAEQMIKLPIVLQEHAHWQAAVAGAVAERAALARTAEGERDYVRPIALYQAEPKDREVTVEVLKGYLIGDLGVPECAVVVATGDQRGLDGIDLSARDCPIEHIITVQALKEGWDCPFAYVFCSVASIKSATAVEQLLGRVLRMPCASRRKVPALNRAYAHVSEPSFNAAATALRDALVDMGFDDSEAEEAIEHPELPLGPRLEPVAPLFEPVELIDTPEVRAILTAQGVPLRERPGGTLALTQADMARPELIDQVLAASPAARAEITARVAMLAPASRGEVMRVPRLMTQVQGQLVLGDIDELMEWFEWSLAGKPAIVPGLSEVLRETVNRFEIDLDGNQVRSRYLSADADLFAGDVGPAGWTPERLVTQLDPLTRQPDLSQADLIGWLVRVVAQLIEAEGLSVAQLMRMKHALARRLKDRINDLRRAHRGGLAQRWLLAPDAPVTTLANAAFEFRAGMYDGLPTYRGRYVFQKHFLERVPAFDGKQDGEEAEFALNLDRLPGLKWWVRNVARHPASFWLQTSTDRTYPDFVAQLEDGRLFVVEYKGADRWKDAQESRTSGAAWERAGGGLYLMARLRDDDGRSAFVQLTDKLRS